MGPKLFDGFKEVLLDTVLTNWEDLICTKCLTVLSKPSKKCIISMSVPRPEIFNLSIFRPFLAKAHAI
jgi:hypothetical protein